MRKEPTTIYFDADDDDFVIVDTETSKKNRAAPIKVENKKNPNNFFAHPLYIPNQGPSSAKPSGSNAPSPLANPHKPLVKLSIQPVPTYINPSATLTTSISSTTSPKPATNIINSSTISATLSSSTGSSKPATNIINSSTTSAIAVNPSVFSAAPTNIINSSTVSATLSSSTGSYKPATNIINSSTISAISASSTATSAPPTHIVNSPITPEPPTVTPSTPALSVPRVVPTSAENIINSPASTPANNDSKHTVEEIKVATIPISSSSSSAMSAATSGSSSAAISALSAPRPTFYMVTGSGEQQHSPLVQLAKTIIYNLFKLDSELTLVNEFLEANAESVLAFEHLARGPENVNMRSFDSSVKRKGVVKPQCSLDYELPPPPPNQNHRDLIRQLDSIFIGVLEKAWQERGPITEQWLNNKTNQNHLLAELKIELKKTWIPLAKQALAEHKAYRDTLMGKYTKATKAWVKKAKDGIQWPHSPEARSKIEEAGFQYSPTVLKRDRCECPTCNAEYHSYRDWHNIQSYHKPHCKSFKP